MSDRIKFFCRVLALGTLVAQGEGLLRAQPVNDRFSARLVLGGDSFLTTGSNVGAGRESGEPAHAGEIASRSVWWTWTAPFSGEAVITTDGSDFDTLLAVYTGSSIASLTEIASNDDDQDLTSRVTFFASEGQAYHIAVDGYDGDFGDVQLAGNLVSTQQATNDLFADRVLVTGTNAVLFGNNVAASAEPGEPDHAGVSGGLSVWWSWTAPFSGMATITTAGSSFDTVMGVYQGTIVSDLAEIASNDDNSAQTDTTSAVTFFAGAGQSYEIAVDGYDGDSGNIRLNIQLAPPQPAPAWALRDPYGQWAYSSNFAGKVVIFNFWASWCVPCKIEIPDLVALEEKYRPDGLAIIGATIDDLLSDTVTFLNTNDPALNYQIIVSDNALAQAYGGVSAIPTTFIINRQNQIVRSYVGTQTRETFESEILPLLYDNTRLLAQGGANELVLSWPETVVTFQLETAATPEGPVWTPWPEVPVLIGGRNTVTVTPDGTDRFFRLRLSP